MKGDGAADRQEEERFDPRRAKGALALVGAWSDLMSDEEIDEFVRAVYAARARDKGRPVVLED